MVLPGCSPADIPLWLAPASATHYQVSEYSVAGSETLLRVLTGQPGETVPPLGTCRLPPRGTATAIGHAGPRGRAYRGGDRGRPVTAGGELESAVWLAGSLLCQRRGAAAGRGGRVWEALRLPALVAADRMAEAGRRLAAALLDRGRSGAAGRRAGAARGR